jgi:ribulose-5-phosphate 4-epimerase/fuculose-1-phosphate aldolase
MLKDLPFDMYHQTSCYFYNDFAYDRDYSGLSFDLNEGERIAKHIGNKRVLFMCNHGVLIVGKSVAEAFNDTYFLERACLFQVSK